ncbi:hypothetical protein AB5J49_14630 [Streptomyces sp. R28]|uniref:Uncharacterized protein n=1 Tax=Streptomyces sp. R28 TaxID=3238628 RepID=A0AB39PUR2_9ACTN
MRQDPYAPWTSWSPHESPAQKIEIPQGYWLPVLTGVRRPRTALGAAFACLVVVIALAVCARRSGPEPGSWFVVALGACLIGPDAHP